VAPTTCAACLGSGVSSPWRAERLVNEQAQRCAGLHSPRDRSSFVLASRIAARAAGGQILIPEPVRHLLSGKTFSFSERGEFALKGFEEPIRLYEVRWRE
jgi:hypothetical protein